MLLPVVQLAILVASISLLRVYPVTATQCTKPIVRKEWRKLSVPEKTDWIRAVNVSGSIPWYVT
jgi:tyrosinase